MAESSKFFPKTPLAKQGKTLTEVVMSLYDNLERYQALADSLSETQFYTPIQPGKWSPADITDHLARANGLYLEALERGNGDREPLELPVGRLTEDGRMRADVALPDAAGKSQAELLGALSAGVDRLVAVGRRADRTEKLRAICLTGGFFGPLTRLEVLGLASVHLRHHAAQLPNGSFP